MTDQFTHYPIPMLLGMFLYSRTDIPDPVPVHGLRDRHIQAFLGDLQELLDRLFYFPDRERIGAVPIKTVHQNPAIHAGNIAFNEGAITGQTMYDLFIYTDQQGRWTSIQAFKSGDATTIPDELLGHPIQFSG